jgi:hypothetical protein
VVSLKGNYLSTREYLKSSRFVFTLIGAVLLITLISYFFPDETVISTTFGISYVLITISTVVVILDSKSKPDPSATFLLMVALFVVITSNLLANTFLVKEKIGNHVNVDFNITLQSIILFNLIIVFLYALVVFIFESWFRDKKTRMAIISLTFIIILGMTFSSFSFTGQKQDRVTTVTLTYTGVIDSVLFYDDSYNFFNMTYSDFLEYTEDFWSDKEEILNQTNTLLNTSGMNQILQDLDEGKLGVVVIFDTIEDSPTLKLTIHFDLINGTIEDIVNGTDEITVPMELTPTEGGTGLLSSYIAHAVDKIAMEDLGGWGMGQDGMYEVIYYTKYSNYHHLMNKIELATKDGKISTGESEEIATSILEDNLITIAPLSELQDIEETISTSATVQQTFENFYQEE